MQAISEEASTTSTSRKVLIAIDDNYACEKACDFALREFYRPGDQVHLIHVIPRAQHRPANYGAPPVDYTPQQSASGFEHMAEEAQIFIRERFLTKLRGLQPPPKVHVIKGAQDTDSIGNIICEKALELRAVCVIMASQGKSKIQAFLLGSTSAYVSKRCKVPVMLVH